ncbi:MAG: serine/threonine protein kinase, partial [Gemmatimonadetes bacterium]|nr:serine/threonine protein kinase [Gemmatimonadota bacterium]
MDKALWQQLQPLMDEALSLTAEARAPWLARIRVEAPTLAGELERLLEQQGTLDRRGFLETPAPGGGLVDQLLAGNATIMQRDRLGEALASRYTLGEPLGQGGMASVYRATDLKHRRGVAIKVIRPDATTALGAERFLAEIRLTANLTHPNILPLLDSGEAAGVLYYVMPLVEGESLRAKLRREGALPLDEATRLLRVVAEALAHAHRKGLVHRDIKPDNVLLSGREAWVADFGIAKAMAATATAAHAATSVGVALGSPGYMAPEQIEASGAVDHRADLYSWGVMAWEVLAGRPPFAGSSMQQLFVQHLTATPEP